MADFEWVKIAASAAELNWNDQGIAVVEAFGKSICVMQWQDQWFGTAYKCPHAGGIMANGFIDARGQIVCPLHRYRFDLKTGRNTSGEGYYLTTYAVENRPEGIFVGRERKKAWSFF